MGEDEARDLISEVMEKQLPPRASLDKVKLEGFLSHWKKAVSSASAYLNNLFIPWFSLTESCNGPTHWGWSRLITENFKSKKYYNLLMTRPPDASRNPNEQKWRNSDLPTFTSERFDKLYRNISKLKCNLRVKYEDFRILWGRGIKSLQVSLFLPSRWKLYNVFILWPGSRNWVTSIRWMPSYRRVHVASTKLV